MTRLLYALVVTAGWCCVDAMREQTSEGAFETELANHSGPTGKAAKAKPTCDDIYKALVNIPVNPSGCNPSHGGKEFCCDSWMNEFGRQLKSYNLAGDTASDVLKGAKLRMKLWKWLIRPKGDTKKNSHRSTMGYDHTYLANGNHDSPQWQHVGKDSHYFTVVNYCPKKYAIFDTIKPVGRDVSEDFNQSKDYEGEAVTYDKIAGPFRFAYSDTIDGEVKECGFNECVAKSCESKWINPTRLMANSAKSKKGSSCFLGIAF